MIFLEKPPTFNKLYKKNSNSNLVCELLNSIMKSIGLGLIKSN